MVATKSVTDLFVSLQWNLVCDKTWGNFVVDFVTDFVAKLPYWSLGLSRHTLIKISQPVLIAVVCEMFNTQLIHDYMDMTQSM